MSPLERFKALTGISDNKQDGVITVLLSDAADAVCDYRSCARLSCVHG